MIPLTLTQIGVRIRAGSLVGDAFGVSPVPVAGVNL